MTQFSRPNKKKPKRLRIVILVVVLFIVLYLLKSADSLIAQFFGK